MYLSVHLSGPPQCHSSTVPFFFFPQQKSFFETPSPQRCSPSPLLKLTVRKRSTTAETIFLLHRTNSRIAFWISFITMNATEYMKQSSCLSNYGRWVALTDVMISSEFGASTQIRLISTFCPSPWIDHKLPFWILVLNIPTWLLVEYANCMSIVNFTLVWWLPKSWRNTNW